MDGFAERLREAAFRKESRVVVGLDPRWEWLPSFLRSEAENRFGKTLEAIEWAFVRFHQAIIERVAPFCVAVKVQAAFFHPYGWRGLRAMEATLQCAKDAGLLTIVDAKLNDIESTAAAYSQAYLGRVATFGDGREPAWDVDALTVNPYLGSDGLVPFIEDCKAFGKGIFVLLRTSNPSAGELQDLPLRPDPQRNPEGHDTVLDAVAAALHRLNLPLVGPSGYGPVGAVVGATYPQELKRLRQAMPHTLFLLPGYGAQGAGAADVAAAFDGEGWGAVVNASRGISFAYRQGPGDPAEKEARFADFAGEAARAMRDAINGVLRKGA